jgi:hypothetical protein
MTPSQIQPREPGKDLSQRHPIFTSFSYFDIYDHVTRMYLDCWNDAEIAHALTEELGHPIEAHSIRTIRIEAAKAAEFQETDVRRRWIYRYSHLSVNNLVKEFMFMEGKLQFLTAKRELSEEIEALVANTPHHRLCIAVNDALGRNNIGIEHISDLLDYARRIRALEKDLALYSESKAMTAQDGLRAFAKEVTVLFNERCQKDPARTAQMLAGIRNNTQTPYLAADIELLVEYDHYSKHEGTHAFLSQQISAADKSPLLSSPLDLVTRGTAKHLSRDALESLIRMLRLHAVQNMEVLGQVRTYAQRHIKDIKTMRELGIHRLAGEASDESVVGILTLLLALVNQHLSLLDATLFFKEADIRKAAKLNITSSDIQTLLMRFNRMEHEGEIRKLADEIQRQRAFAFPVERYLATRFNSPE